MIFLVLLFLLVACVSFCFIKQYQIYKEIWQIPGPIPLPFLGNVLELGTNAVEFLANLQRLSKKYGSITRLCIGPRNGILITNPNHIAKVFTAAQHYNKGDYFDVLKPMIGADNIVMSSGNKWIRQRRILSTAFSNKQLEKYVAVFNQTARNLVEQLNEKVHLSSVDVTETVFSNSLNAICKAAMHIDVSENVEYHRATMKLFDLFLERITSPLKKIDFLFRFTENYRETMKCVSVLDGVANTVIKTRKWELQENSADKSSSSVLDQLFRLSGEDSLSEQEIREQIQTFIAAGSDTIGMVISFAMYELARHPEVQAKVLEETEAILGANPSDDINFEDLHKLKYTECVLKEVMRLYPPAALLTRLVPEDIYLDEYRIPANTTIFIFLYGLHRSGEIYTNPEKFDPDRFFLGRCDASSFMPFGGGLRICLGQKFAMLEMKVMLAKIVRNFRLSQHQGHKLELCMNLTLASNSGLPVVLKSRKSST